MRDDEMGFYFHINKNLFDKFTNKAKEAGITRAAMIRDAITRYVYTDKDDDALIMYKQMCQETQVAMDKVVAQYGGK